MAIQPYVFDLGEGFEGDVPVDNFALFREDGVRVYLDVVGDKYILRYDSGGIIGKGMRLDTISAALREMADILEE